MTYFVICRRTLEVKYLKLPCPRNVAQRRHHFATRVFRLHRRLATAPGIGLQRPVRLSLQL